MRAASLSLDDLDTARKHAGKWADAGYGYLVCGWPEAGDAQVERLRPRRDGRVHRLTAGRWVPPPPPVGLR